MKYGIFITMLVFIIAAGSCKKDSVCNGGTVISPANGSLYHVGDTINVSIYTTGCNPDSACITAYVSTADNPDTALFSVITNPFVNGFSYTQFVVIAAPVTNQTIDISYSYCQAKQPTYNAAVVYVQP
jgi:hypothetical protein